MKSSETWGERSVYPKGVHRDDTGGVESNIEFTPIVLFCIREDGVRFILIKIEDDFRLKMYICRRFLLQY